MSVRRGDGTHIIINGKPPAFDYINKYLITDYSDFDAHSLVEILSKYDCDMINKAIKVGRDNNVYNIPYIKAVLEREQATINIKKQRYEKMASKADSSAEILHTSKVNNSITDVVSASYNWDKAKEDAELMDKFNKMFGG